MENKLASHWDMELLKMAMRRHEETFRQQVPYHTTLNARHLNSGTQLL